MQTHTQLKMFFVGVLSAFAKRTAPTQAIATLLLAVFVQAVLGTQSAHAQTFTVLYNFAGPHIRWDGAYPAGGLVQDASGNLYGTTQKGGAYNFGTVFKVDTTGKETVLYSFAGGADGEYPLAAL